MAIADDGTERVAAVSLSPDATDAPLLSFVLCSRNDRYQGDSKWRLEIALNSACEAARAVGRAEDLEIVLADWGSREPLRDCLNLTAAAAARVRILHVPEEVVSEVSTGSPFAEVLALNTAVRRARGTWIGRIDQDAIIRPRFLARMLDILEGRLDIGLDPRRAMFLANRRQVPFRFAARRPSLWSVHRFVDLYGSRLPLMFPMEPERFYQSFVGIWLLHRDAWHAARGFDERMVHRNWMESDMYLRLRDRMTLVDLGALTDHAIWHLDHIDPLRAEPARPTNPRADDQVQRASETNGPHWGLAAVEVIEGVTPPRTGRAASTAPEPVRFAWLVLLARVHTLLDMFRLGVLRPHEAQWPTFDRSTGLWHRCARFVRTMARGRTRQEARP